jgi:hypothetical protein
MLRKVAPKEHAEKKLTGLPERKMYYSLKEARRKPDSSSHTVNMIQNKQTLRLIIL